ncbi:MAG: aminotransferase class I/II-fold pyridoxal phosphate-dependent enzyme [Planctomycetes bacterium]|nr:aminotransferase class I/II-fold pyridoxal phosphate-dependent enzyme [Planctomycetota bacterium]
MSAPIADFRSDTMTRPTPAMRAAMASAEVGDDVWGEDPTVRQLEAEGAGLLGKEAAVFVPSGTMANQIAIHLHCRPGDELICEERSHVFVNEAGGIARWSGTQVKPLAAQDGFPTPSQVEGAVRADDVHYPRSRLLVLENTHNSAGGRVASAARVGALAAAAKKHGLAVHCDGARLANAAVALGCPMADLAAALDSTTLCLSKGLGAPVGSLVAGSAAFAKDARRARKAFGGGMRQAGVLAAAGLIALRDGPALLRRDHERAKDLARGLAEVPWARVDAASVETNIVMCELVGIDPAPLLEHLRDHGVLAATMGPRRVRFVLHRDVDDAGVRACLAACRSFAATPSSSPVKGLVP